MDIECNRLIWGIKEYEKCKIKNISNPTNGCCCATHSLHEPVNEIMEGI